MISLLEQVPLRVQFIKFLEAGGFSLRKWIANTPELLNDLPEEVHLQPALLQLTAEGPVNKLGVAWNPSEDKFKFTLP